MLLCTVTIKGESKKAWYDDKIHEERKKRRQLERQLRKTGLEVHRQMLHEHSKTVVHMINCAKSSFFQAKLQAASSKDTFKVINGLLGANHDVILPTAESNQELADKFATYFNDKVLNIRRSLDSMVVQSGSQEDLPPIPPRFSAFSTQSIDSVHAIIKKCAPKTCSLDPIPTSLLEDPGVLNAALPKITTIIKQSLTSGVVPSVLKRAQVAPLLKKSGLDVNNYKNYRPVSNIPFIGKVLEKVVAKQLTQHLQQHQLHDELQSAYKQGCSTETALIKIKADMDHILDQGHNVLLILLDLSAAFDTIDHTILLQRLEQHVGLTATALQWVRSYLHGRTQAVHIEDSVSKQVPLSIGVPQGSVLGPLLFLVYILPLKALIDRHVILRHGFADDTQLYSPLPRRDITARRNRVERMEGCIAELREWMCTNKLKLNDEKTECMVISGKNSKPVQDISIKIGDVTINPASTAQNLGATLDRELSMQAQVNRVIKSVYYHLRRVAHIRRHLTQESCATVIHAMVTSRLDFHNGLLAGAPEKSLSRLQVAQNNAARLLTGTNRRAHMTPVLSHLHWLPVRHRVTFKILMMVHKLLHSSTSPHYLRELLTVYHPRRALRSASDQWTLTVPRAARQYGSRSFQVHGAKLWNDLPADLREPQSTQTFKRKLKTFLYRQAFI